MMETATWLAVAILGPGSSAVFIWFLVDVRALFRRAEEKDVDQVS